MRPTILSLLLTCAWTCRAVAADEAAPVPRLIEPAESVLAIYPEDWGLHAKNRISAIVLAIWPDGYVVWSKDRVKGGEPYYSARIDPELVSAVLSEFERDGLFADKSLNQPHFGDDSFCTTLFVKSGKKQVRMQSWHEAGEAGGGSVATATGLTTLQGRARFEVLRNQPTAYLHYRFVWSETRGKMFDLIPLDGKPIAGTPEAAPHRLLWREAPAGGRPANDGGAKKK